MDTQTTTNYAILLASLIFLTILLAMFMFALFRQYRFRLKEYDWQLAREVELIDSERKRIHIDLHDEIGAGLASISVLVQQQTVHDNSIHKKVLKQVQNMRSKIREIAYNFIPPSLDTLGLKTTLVELLIEINAIHKIKVKSNLEFDDQNFIPQKAIHIYRITKEILTNTLKHASCSSINCSMQIQQKNLVLSISDNGTGFNTENKNWMSKGAGLSHIYSRVRLLRATIAISSIYNKGTSYEIRIPLESLLNQQDNG
jgi:two-component system, NarL family, sensor kinase